MCVVVFGARELQSRLIRGLLAMSPTLISRGRSTPNIGMLSGMHTTQIAVRVPDELLVRLDQQIPHRFASRAEAVRDGLVALLQESTMAERIDRHRQAWIEQPLSPSSESQLRADALALIAEEPW